MKDTATLGRKTMRKKHYALLIGCLAALFGMMMLISGCGDSGESGDGAGTDSGEAAASAAAGALDPDGVRGGKNTPNPLNINLLMS